MKSRLRIALAVLVLATVARAEDQDEQALWTVCADVQMVSVSPERGLALIPQLRDARSFDAAFGRLQKIIAGEPATLLGWPLIRSRGGEQCWAENDEDGRFRIADDLNAFEIRNLGPRLEATPIVRAGGASIQIEIIACFVRLLGVQRYPDGQTPIGFNYVTEQPTFSNLNVSATLNIANGGRLLLGSFLVPSPSPHVVLFILHATAVRADSPKPKPSP
jgi:hypothetical protein